MCVSVQMCVGTHYAGVCVGRGLRLMSDALLNCFPLLFLERESLAELRACQVQLALWVLCLFPEFRQPPHLPGFYVSSGDPNSGPHACMARTSFTEPSPWPLDTL